MTIRKYEEKDFDQLVFLDTNSGHIFYEKNPRWKKGVPKWMKKMLRKINTEYYVFEEDNHIFGAVGLIKEFSPHNSCEMVYLAVLKEKHGQGTGGKLVDFIEERARKLGFERIFLYTGFDNVSAQNFYLKKNYQKINEFPKYYSWGETAFLYGKKLQ